MTHVATAHAVSYSGTSPIIADINLYKGSMNLKLNYVIIKLIK